MRIKAASAVVIVALTILMGASLARADGGFEITWYTVDGGGATFSAGDGYTLGGTIGQPDAGGPQTADGYTLQGGFWGAALEGEAASPAEPVPGLTSWGLWTLAGLLMIAVPGRIWYRGRDGRATAGPSAARLVPA